MTLLFIDGFDHYDAGDSVAHLRKWTTATATHTYDTGRSGSGGALRIYGGSCSRTLTLSSTYVIGFAANFTAIPNIANVVFEFLGENGSAVISVRQNIVGTLSILVNGTAVATSTETLPTSVWVYLELKAVAATGATGSVELKMNGVTIASASSIVTVSAPNTGYNAIRIVTITSTGLQTKAYTIDDLYVCNQAGSVNNDFLGDVKVATLYPDGDVVSNFTATGAGTTNADRVDENPPDDDTTYVESSTVGNDDRYTYTNLPSDVGTVHGVQVVPLVTKVDDGGSRTFRALSYSVATEAVGSTVGLATGYLYYPHIFEQDPDASAAWTKATVDAASFGFEIVA